MLCSQLQKKWVATATEQKEADERMAKVMRIPGYFTRVQGVFKNTGKLKSADWLHFLTTGILYVLKPIVRGRQERALVALVRALRLAVHANSDRDPMITAFPEHDFERRAQHCQQLKLKIIGYLCEYENGAAMQYRAATSITYASPCARRNIPVELCAQHVGLHQQKARYNI